MIRNKKKAGRPDGTAAWAAAGVFAASAAYNIYAAASGAQPAYRSAVQVSILFLALAAALLSNAFAAGPSYPRFLRDAAIAGTAAAALSGVLYALAPGLRAYAGCAALYSVEMTAGFVLLAAAGRVLKGKHGAGRP